MFSPSVRSESAPVVGLRIVSETASSPVFGYVTVLKARCGEITSAVEPVGLEGSI
jgi:hypothetical protein